MRRETGEEIGLRIAENQFERRKKTVYDFICSDVYVPMKIKELAIFFQVAKEDRAELEDVLQALNGANTCARNPAP